jgi:hypothetical protein
MAKALKMRMRTMMMRTMRTMKTLQVEHLKELLLLAGLINGRELLAVSEKKMVHLWGDIVPLMIS